MAQFTYKDIEEFLLDDDFFQWARYGSSDNGFNLESYKLQHPGCEEKIELAVAMVRSMKVVENSKPTSREYKMQSFNKMMSKLQQQPSQPVRGKCGSLIVCLFGNLLCSIQIRITGNYRCYSPYN